MKKSELETKRNGKIIQKVTTARSLPLGRSLVSVKKKNERINLVHFSNVEEEFRVKTWNIIKHEIHPRVNSIM